MKQPILTTASPKTKRGASRFSKPLKAAAALCTVPDRGCSDMPV
jgi:hypothetical protein